MRGAQVARRRLSDPWRAMGCPGDGTCLLQANIPGGYRREGLCKFQCTVKKCPNWIFCHADGPEWYFLCHGGTCFNCRIGFRKPKVEVVPSGSIPTPTSLKSFFRQINVNDVNIHHIIEKFITRKCSVCHETPPNLNLRDFARNSLEKYPVLLTKNPLVRFPTCHHFACFECMGKLTEDPSLDIQSLDPRDFGCEPCPNNCENLCECEEFEEKLIEWDWPDFYHYHNWLHKFQSTRTRTAGSCPSCCTRFMKLNFYSNAQVEGGGPFWEFCKSACPPIQGDDSAETGLFNFGVDFDPYDEWHAV